MSKLDCTNIYTFMEEWDRRRKTSDVLYVSGEDIIKKLSSYNKEDLENIVNKLQEWSNLHPRLTRKENFIKMCEENGFDKVLKDYCCELECSVPCVESENCGQCKKYWNEYVD